ncbi:MAG: thioredoxin-disulfide reductase [Candidatus Nanoarchaeia archaeon]
MLAKVQKNLDQSSSEQAKEFDLIIIGGGPAGLTAAIYSARRALSTLVITKAIGGQIANARLVENFPGFEAVSGAELSNKMLNQAQKFGAKIIFGEVKEILKEDNKFIVKTSNSGFAAKALILAFGKTPRALNAKNEDKFIGKGVSYCATCDMPVFKNKIVAVIGGGNSAFDAAVYGSTLAKKVYLIHRREEFRADESTVEKAKKIPNIEFLLNYVVKEIKGDKFVKSILLENTKTRELRELSVDGVFVEIGYDVKTEIVEKLVKLDEQKQIIVNEKCETSCPGIFAAGDVTNTPFKQAIVAAGDGCKAALSAYAWLKGHSGITAEWGKLILKK